MSSSSPTQPRWIISFADLLSVILAFLVLSYSMSLPPNKETTGFDKKEGDNVFSVKKSETETKVNIDLGSGDDLSTNYLYQITEKKIKNDAELSSKLKLQSVGDSLVITLSASNYIALAPKLTQMLKNIKNDIWIYSNNLQTSRRAYEELQKKGFDKTITYVEKEMPDHRIDIVIHP